MPTRSLLFAATLLVAFVPIPAIAQSTNTTPQQPTSQAPSKPWWERLIFYGDFRVRYEGFFQDETETRQRGRYRFRLGMRTPVAEGVDFNVRLASGEASDVTSTNQTFTDFLNRKAINIDQLSLTYTPPSLKALTLGAGKYAMPVTRTQMVWDDDVNWEGAYEQVTWTMAPVTFRVVGVQSPINEVGGGEDAFLFGQYVHAGFRVGGHAVQLSVADYAFQNPDQIAVALDQRTVIRTQSTNALRRDSSGRVVGYLSGFNLVDFVAQATLTTGRTDYPFQAVADFVLNTEAATDEDVGVWLAGTYGRATTPKTCLVSYTFARVERDAVVSAYNFSDMGPASNVIMNMATFSYMPKARVNLEFIAIFTKLIEVPVGGTNPLLKRIQVDARVSF